MGFGKRHPSLSRRCGHKMALCTEYYSGGRALCCLLALTFASPAKSLKYHVPPSGSRWTDKSGFDGASYRG